METKGRRTDPPLVKTLFDEPYSFSFFQAVRVLERRYHKRLPVGRLTESDGAAVEPAHEVARFRTHATLSFPPSEIHALTRDGDDKPPQMTVAFMGLTGPSGVL